MTRLSAAIPAYRRSRSLTQKQLAEQLDISESTVRNWERGRRVPTQEHRRRLLELMGRFLRGQR